jgi:hypothetical protein
VSKGSHWVLRSYAAHGHYLYLHILQSNGGYLLTNPNSYLGLGANLASRVITRESAQSTTRLAALF